MNPDIKAQWVAALRSGEYKQGTGWLAKNGQYCCLGVLCELASMAGVVKRQAGEHAVFYGEADAFLPGEVVRWAGLESLRPQVGETPLDVYNDGNFNLDVEPHTFSEIADLIEEHL